MKKQVYAVCEGKNVLFHGTKEEISEITGLSKSTLHSYASPEYLKRHEKTDALKLLKMPGVLR
jgi:hypothetical protein